MKNLENMNINVEFDLEIDSSYLCLELKLKTKYYNFEQNDIFKTMITRLSEEILDDVLTNDFCKKNYECPFFEIIKVPFLNNEEIGKITVKRIVLQFGDKKFLSGEFGDSTLSYKNLVDLFSLDTDVFSTL